MSPYVWRQADGRLGIMVRAVPPLDGPQTDTGVVWYGTSDDGQRFGMTDAPVIAPGPGPEDEGGIEDPTVLRWHDDIVVYYTGVTADHSTGQMLYAVGPSPTELYKKGVALASSKSKGNVKEGDGRAHRRGQVAAVLRIRSRARVLDRHGHRPGRGRAVGGRCRRLWLRASTRGTTGTCRPARCCSTDPECPVMFYNGATRDARWRIGWVAFDRDCLKVVDRGYRTAHHPAARRRPHRHRHRVRGVGHHGGGRHDLALLLVGGPDAGAGQDRAELRGDLYKKRHGYPPIRLP